jgi:hypothetical protein
MPTELEKQIAQTILDAIKIHEASWDNSGHGKYIKDEYDSFKEAAEKNKIPENLWYVLTLANHWTNDLQNWAEHILKGKNMTEQFFATPDTGKDKVEV